MSIKKQKRKWKEKDIELTKERHKRILRSKQDKLMNKEKMCKTIMLKKEAEKIESQKKLEQNIQDIKQRDLLMNTLTKVINTVSILSRSLVAMKMQA